MTTSRTPRHRKPSPATKVRMVALRSAAIGAVAVPTTAMSTSVTPPLQPQSQPQPQHTHIPPGIRTDEAEQHREVMAASKKIQTIAEPVTKTVVYEVREGDTLSAIAERKLGSADDYPQIFAANKDRLESDGEHFTDPSLIMPGWSLTLSTATVKEKVKQEAVSTKRVAASKKSTGSGLKSWIDEAISVLHEHGYDVSYDAVYETAMHESGGDPRSVNESDSNAASGHPSIGLMQTIQPTFDAYALPGYRDIYNPVDNIIAAARYAAAVYGSLDEMVEARCDGSCWRGY